MTRFHRLFSEGSDKYAKFRPTYPAELYQRILDYGCLNRELAIDVATGTGQAAAELAKSFANVIGVDVSPQQIANVGLLFPLMPVKLGLLQAETIPNVTFQIAAAESLVEDAQITKGSADLITVAQGLHWFDLRAFYGQCRKALKPGGTFAAWGYNLFRYPDNPAANNAMKVPVFRHVPCLVVGP